MIIRDYLEAEIVGHCNLRCGQCSHHSPFITKEIYELQQFSNDLKELSKFLNVKEFRLLGGEPFLSKNISQYIYAVRDSGITESIGVCTNGLLLDRIDNAFMRQIDFLDVSLYPIDERLINKILLDIERLKSAYSEKIRVMITDDFRYSNIVFKNENMDLVNKIWDNCKMRRKCHAIYNGFYFICMASQRKAQFLKAVLGEENRQLSDPITDGIRINEKLEEDLIFYLNRDIPLSACKWCLGSSGRRTKNLQNSFELITDPSTLRNYVDIE